MGFRNYEFDQRNSLIVSITFKLWPRLTQSLYKQIKKEKTILQYIQITFATEVIKWQNSFANFAFPFVNTI